MKTKIIIEEMLKKEGNKKNLAIVAGIAIILNSGKLKKEKLKGGRFYTDGRRLFNIIKQEVEDAKPFKVFKIRKLSVKENGNTPIFHYLEILERVHTPPENELELREFYNKFLDYQNILPRDL